MRCPSCEAANVQGAVRCKKCGKKLPRQRRREEEDKELEDEEELDQDEEEEEERPRRRLKLIPKKNPKALAAYYVGMFSLIPGLGFVLGPIAFVLGVLGYMYSQENPKAKGGGHAIAGIVLGLIGVIFSVVILVLIQQNILSLHRFTGGEK
jgi:hypothetical protein